MKTKCYQYETIINISLDLYYIKPFDRLYRQHNVARNKKGTYEHIEDTYEANPKAHTRCMWRIKIEKSFKKIGIQKQKKNEKGRILTTVRFGDRKHLVKLAIIHVFAFFHFILLVIFLLFFCSFFF